MLGHVERVVRATGIAVPTADSGAPQLKVIVNNIADLGSASAKGVGTGLTFGLAGSVVSDYYEMQVVLTRGQKTISKDGYKHALHSTIGNASGPAGLDPTTPAAGFGKIVEQMLLNALKDLDADPELAFSSRSWWAKLMTMLQG